MDSSSSSSSDSDSDSDSSSNDGSDSDSSHSKSDSDSDSPEAAAVEEVTLPSDKPLSPTEAMIRKSMEDLEQKKLMVDNDPIMKKQVSKRPPPDPKTPTPAEPESIRPRREKDESRMFKQTMNNFDTVFNKYVMSMGHTEEEAHNLHNQDISKASWEKMENGERLNDEIARALLNIMAQKLKDMGLNIAGFQDPKFHGPQLQKRTPTRFRGNNTAATVNVFNDGENCYVCAIQQGENLITYCNSRNPGHRPSKYVLDQMKKAFDLRNWGGAFQVQSHYCQRQVEAYNDSLLWSIVNIYIILKGNNVATIKLREKTVRDDFKKMLLTKKWVTLLKKDVKQRQDPDDYVITSHA